MSSVDTEAAARVTNVLARCGATIEAGPQPSKEALCIVTPLGDDVTTCAVREGLDPYRTLGVDMFTDCTGGYATMVQTAENVASELGTLNDMDVIEINEAFAPQVLACLR